MILPAGFMFSQASLQDYVDCPRRFELRYVLGIAWPTPIAQDALEAELHLERGASFHRLVHQHLLGIPATLLAESIEDPELQRWWEAYRRHAPQLEGTITPEAVLSVPVGGCRLMAKLDAVSSVPGEGLIIVDWKTNRRRPPRGWLESRMQTRVYRYVVVRGGSHLNAGFAVDASNVEMLYWFAQFPAQPERFGYDQSALAQDEAFLAALVDEIQKVERARPMALARDHRKCTFCHYRTLCERDVVPGDVGDLDDEHGGLSFDFDMDIEQVAEVDF